MEPKWISCRPLFVSVVNGLLSFFVVSILVVCYWRGTWEILNMYLFPDNSELTAWVSVAIGNGIILLFSLFQNVFSKLTKIKNPVVYFIVSRLYVYILGFGCVNQWRGIWFLQDLYTKIMWQSAAGSVLIGVSVLGGFRCLSGILAPPLILSRDSDRTNVFALTRRFTTKATPSVTFVLDVCFTVIFVNNLVVFFWRGFWTLLDLYLKHDDVILSAAYSFVISFSLAIPVLLGQYGIQSMSKYLQKRTYLLPVFLEIAFLVISGALSVSHWRGAWLLQDALLFPDNKVLSVWVSHGVGCVGLLILFSLRSFLTSGCFLDTDIHKSDVKMFDLSFFKCGEHIHVLEKDCSGSYGVVITKVELSQPECDTRL